MHLLDSKDSQVSSKGTYYFIVERKVGGGICQKNLLRRKSGEKNPTQPNDYKKISDLLLGSCLIFFNRTLSGKKLLPKVNVNKK